MESRGTLFIISAPSGGGKTSLITALLKKLPGLSVSVSHTTRAPRQGEVEGKNYFFVDEGSFKAIIQKGEFLEHAKVFSHWYGTSSRWVMEHLNKGIDVILEIDWQGAQRIRAQMDCISIFILPPSREALLTRLEARRQDSKEVIAERMLKASQEISHYSEYDYLVINEDFEQALADLMAIIGAQRTKTSIQKQRYAALLASLV